MVWPVDFNFQQKAEASQKFVKAYQAANSGENPVSYTHLTLPTSDLV